MVGFADLVNFTALVRRVSERQLATLVQRFEQLASDIVTAHGGRVIKTVGDEMLYVSTEPLAAAGIALDLVDAMAEEPMLPQVRVGVSYGPVLSRMGDVFGTTVNRAAAGCTAVAAAATGPRRRDPRRPARRPVRLPPSHPLAGGGLRGIGEVAACHATRTRVGRHASVRRPCVRLTPPRLRCGR